MNWTTSPHRSQPTGWDGRMNSPETPDSERLDDHKTLWRIAAFYGSGWRQGGRRKPAGTRRSSPRSLTRSLGSRTSSGNCCCYAPVSVPRVNRLPPRCSLALSHLRPRTLEGKATSLLANSERRKSVPPIAVQRNDLFSSAPHSCPYSVTKVPVTNMLPR